MAPIEEKQKNPPETPKPEPPKSESAKAATPKAESPQAEAFGFEGHKFEGFKLGSFKDESPKAKSSKSESPKAESPQAEPNSQPQEPSDKPEKPADPPTPPAEPADPRANMFDQFKERDSIRVGDVTKAGVMAIGTGATVNYYLAEAHQIHQEIHKDYARLDRERAKVAAKHKKNLQDDKSFIEWFYGLQPEKRKPQKPGLDIEEQYFVLAAALFEGITWTRFLEIHHALLEQVELTEDKSTKLRIQSYGFELDEEKLEERTFVKRFTIPKENKFGNKTTTVVGFSERETGQCILKMLRRKNSARLRDVLPVIQHYGTLTDPYLRIQAAKAAAEIARVDFEYIWHSLVIEWAGDEHAYVREVVGYFVAHLLEAEVAVGNLLGELPTWTSITKTSDWKLRWAAAQAYKEVALFRPTQEKTLFQPFTVGMGALKTLAVDSSLDVKESVVYALIAIYTQDYPGEVLATLSDWAKLPEHSRDETEQDIERNAVCLWTLLALASINFETDEWTGVSNLFRLLAQSPQSQVAQSVAAILMPTNRQSFGFVTQILRVWAKSELSQATTAVACTLAAIYHRVDERLRIAILNLINRWRQAPREKALVEAAQQALGYIQAN